MILLLFVLFMYIFKFILYERVGLFSLFFLSLPFGYDHLTISSLSCQKRLSDPLLSGVPCQTPYVSSLRTTNALMSYYSKFRTRSLTSSTCAALIELYHSHLNGDTSSDGKVQVSEVCMLVILGYHLFMQGYIVPNDLCGFKITALHHLLYNEFWRR